MMALEAFMRKKLDEKLVPFSFKEDMKLIQGRIEIFYEDLNRVMKLPNWVQEKEEIFECGLTVHYISKFIERMYRTYKKDRVHIIELKKKFYSHPPLKELHQKLRSDGMI